MGGPRPLPIRDTYVKGQITAALAPEAPKIYAEVFVDPSSRQSLFKHEQGQLFIAHRDHRELLIFTDGATKWCKVWERNGWKKSNGAPLKNQDLWELLLERLRELQSTRCQKISFWHIPREQNEEADQAAKYAATLAAHPKFGIPSPDNFLVLVDPSQL
jgi:hypothetical protein